MEVKIVLGHLFGDEGKGVTTQWLCQQALSEGKRPAVVRFSGGPQAGHTICHNGTEHICSTYGSGTLLGVPTIILDYYDPISANKEREVLEEKMGEVPMLYVDMHAKTITPFDVLAGISNEKVLSDGTCGKGLFPTFERYKTKPSFLNGRFRGYEHMSELMEFAICARYYHSHEEDKWIELFTHSVEAMCPHKTNITRWDLSLPKIGYDFDTFIFEGSQGLLLDMDNGFMPHCTPSRVGLNGILSDYLPDAEVYLVSRTYLTRHGNGYTPRIPLTWDLSAKHETNVCNDYQGEFKVGAMEPDLLRTAFHRHRLDNYKALHGCHFNLVVTHTDVCPDPDAAIQQMLTAYPEGFIENVYTNDSPESNLSLWKR